MKQDFSILGNYFKIKRLALDLNQREVSEFLGYNSPQFISNVERGMCQLPMKAIRKLITLYKLDVYEVFDIIMSQQAHILRAELHVKGELGHSRRIVKATRRG